MSAEKPMTDQSMLWGHAIHFWDVWGVRMMLVGAFLGFIALAASLFSSFVLYRVASVAQSDLETKTGSLNVALKTQEDRTAAAQLEAERIKSLVNWREVDPDTLIGLISDLSRLNGSVTFAYVQNDPEALNFTILLQKIFEAANNTGNWKIEAQPRMYTDRNIFGLYIFGRDGDVLANVRTAFEKAKYNFLPDHIPPPQTRIGGMLTSSGEPTTEVVIMVGSKKPPNF